MPGVNFQLLVPACHVSVGGSPLPLEKGAALTRVTVELDGDLFGQCVLQFNDPDLRLINGKDFAAGTAVKVELGFAPLKKRGFEGQVVALDSQFLRYLPASLKVVCHEVLDSLALAGMTRAFND